MDKLMRKLYLSNWYVVLMSLVMLVLTIGIDAVAPGVTKRVTEVLTNSPITHPHSLISYMLDMMGEHIYWGTVVIFILSVIFNGLLMMAQSKLTWDVVNEGRMYLYRKLADDTRHFQSESDLINFVHNDAFQIISIRLDMYSSWLLLGLNLLIGSVMIYMFINVGAVICIWIVSIIVIIGSFGPRYYAMKFDKEADRNVTEYRKEVTGFAILLREYRLYGSQSFALQKIRRTMDIMSKSYLKSEWAQGWAESIAFGLRTIGLLGVVLIGKVVMEWFSLTVADLLTMTQYLFHILMPLYRLNHIYKNKKRLQNVEKRVNEIIDFSYDEDEEDKNKAEMTSVSSIEFIGAKYVVPNDGDGFYVLNGINLKIKSGTMVGVVGKSGSGKSTLIKSLYRGVDITYGDILINGRSIREYKRKSIYKNFFIVEQETKVIEGTIADNLRSARPDASDKLMKKALQFAELGYLNLDELIENPKGRYLSGGEKQRLAFAKLYLRPECSVVILDEATSALDEDVQFELLVKLNNDTFRNRHIIISVAHRLSTIMNSDQIIVVSHGEITERGTHDELMKNNNGYYKKLNDAANRFKQLRADRKKSKSKSSKK